jgi:transportin-3
MRGLTKVLSEAGENYVPLMLQHPATFQPIVAALAECARCDDLDIVQLTFSFWYRLAKQVQKAADNPAIQPYVDVFGALVDIIFEHLRYSEDPASLTPQERDDFREFRHNIGDTLKDCCEVLGVTACLKRAFDMMTSELAKGSATKWQAIEAPLFGMRSLGSRVDPRDNSILPQIMSILPKLPAHPKIRYTAILVIARYTEWTNEHPEHIPFQLEYVSAGFGDADKEVWLASANAIKYLCSDCSEVRLEFFPDHKLSQC